MFHARNHPAIDGILAIQEMVVLEIDEELAVGRVRVLRPGRAQRAAVMRQAREFGRQVRQVRATRARTARIVVVFHIGVFHVAGLGHEAVDHAVKGHIVVFPGAGQFLHPRGMFGGHVGQQFDHHRAVLQLDDDGVFGILDLGHGVLLGESLGADLSLSSRSDNAGRDAQLAAGPCSRAG